MEEKDRKELYDVMRRTYDELIDFVMDTPFKDALEEMYTLKPEERPGYVRDVLLDAAALEKRGIKVPEGILIQRSSFGDARPSLVVVKKYLPDGYRSVWENVNLTFDQQPNDKEQPSPTASWQKPLPPSVLAATQALGMNIREIHRIRALTSS